MTEYMPIPVNSEPMQVGGSDHSDILTRKFLRYMFSLATLLFVVPYGIRKSLEIRRQVDAFETSAPTPTTAPSPVRADSDTDSVLTSTAAILGIIVAALAIILLGWIILMRIRRDINKRRAERRRIAGLRSAQAATWETYKKTYREIASQVLATETDWDTIFLKPALNDLCIPVTAKAWRAWQDASNIDSNMPADLDPEADVTTLPFPKAVTRLQTAWKAADNYATQVGQKKLPRTERCIIRDIRGLLRLAENDGASEGERRAAYLRIDNLVKKLRIVTVPKNARKRIGARASNVRQIEARVPAGVS